MTEFEFAAHRSSLLVNYCANPCSNLSGEVIGERYSGRAGSPGAGRAKPRHTGASPYLLRGKNSLNFQVLIVSQEAHERFRNTLLWRRVGKGGCSINPPPTSIAEASPDDLAAVVIRAER